MATRIRLGELLVRAGVLDEFKLRAALAEQQRWGGRLGKVLVDMGFLSEDLLVKALSKQLGVSRADMAQASVPSELIEKLELSYLREHAVCPVQYDVRRKIVVLAMADPTNIQASDEIRFRTGLRIEALIAGEQEISNALDRMTGPSSFDGALARVRTLSSDQMAYRAAMAASGLSVDGDNAGEGVVERHPANASRPPNGAPDSSPVAAPVKESAAMTPAVESLADRMESAQRQQHRAVRAMVELLIEKGVFSKDEYLRLVNKG